MANEENYNKQLLEIEEENFQPLKDTVYLEVDYNAKKRIKSGNLDIEIIDTGVALKNTFELPKDFPRLPKEEQKMHLDRLRNMKKFNDNIVANHYKPENAVQEGIVKYVPIKTSKRNKVKIKEGDKVYTHHFLCDHDQLIIINGQKLSKMNYDDQIYGIKREDTIEMINGWNFIEPIKETDEDCTTVSGIFFKAPGKKFMRGRAKYINDDLKSMGVAEGDVIVYEKVADYEMEVEGDLLYRIRNTQIISIVGK